MCRAITVAVHIIPYRIGIYIAITAKNINTVRHDEGIISEVALTASRAFIASKMGAGGVIILTTTDKTGQDNKALQKIHTIGWCLTLLPQDQ